MRPVTLAMGARTTKLVTGVRPVSLVMRPKATQVYGARRDLGIGVEDRAITLVLPIDQEK